MAPTVSLPAETLPTLARLDAKQLWRPAAPGAVRDAWRAGERDAAWTAWRDHCAAQSSAPADDLLWGLPAEQAAALKAWRRQALAEPAGVAAAWLDQLDQRPADVPFALEAIAWAESLVTLAGRLDADAWWRLVGALVALAEESGAAAAPDPAEAEATVVEQLLAGELPLRLSRTLPELRPLHELATPSRTALSEGLERLTDGEGTLTASLWTDATTPASSLLLASWTRCAGLAESGKAPWTGDAQLQYEWLVRQCLRAADRSGRLAFAPADTHGASEMLRRALDLGGDESDQSAATRRLKGYKADDEFETPTPANHSEWAELGVLAAGWRDKAPRIVVAHPADTMRVEVRSGRQTLLAGDWPVDASIDGASVRSTDDWECQCWYSDDDCDYLELALPLRGGARLERQLFLSREDGVGFLAESLFSGAAPQDTSRALSLTTRLPLGEGVTLRPEQETREATLTAGDDAVAGVVPLALAEWRDDPRGGELTAEEGRLVLTRQASGRNLVSPLWIDFAPRRFAKQRTWRQLTVAEALKPVSRDVAVGYRVQAAKHQWLIYRSLDKPGNRTVLGQNYSSEQIVGRYKAPEGTVDEYFEIEGEED